MSEAVLVIQTAEVAEKLLSPIRLRILERLGEPASASSLAPDLGLTRQQANYHLRELEETGVIELAETRRRGNFLERVYRLSAESLLIAPSALGPIAVNRRATPDARTPGYLVALGARLIEDVAELYRDSRHVPTLALETEISFAGDAERAAFASDLAEAFRSLAEKYHHEDGSGGTFRLLAAAHPCTSADRQVPEKS